jgi:hypothetical protein
MAKLAIAPIGGFIYSPAVDFGTGSTLLTWTSLPIRRCNGKGDVGMERKWSRQGQDVILDF